MKIQALTTLAAGALMGPVCILAINAQLLAGSANARPNDADPSTTPPSSTAPTTGPNGITCTGTATPDDGRKGGKDAVHAVMRVDCSGTDTDGLLVSGNITITGPGRTWQDPFSYRGIGVTYTTTKEFPIGGSFNGQQFSAYGTFTVFRNGVPGNVYEGTFPVTVVTLPN